MDFTVNSMVVAKIRPVQTILNRLLGSYELIFRVGLTVLPIREDKTHRMAISGARVTINSPGGEITDLGFARSDKASVVMQYAHMRDHEHWDCAMTLAPYQLEMLETLRNGGDLNFTLSFMARSNTSPADAVDWEEQGQFALNFPVDQSAWIKQLGHAKADNIFLFEVRLTTDQNGVLSHPADRHLLKAREQFLAGHWRECVAECRQFAEELGGSGMDAAFNKLTTDRRTTTKEDRELALVGALQHYGHLAAHSGRKHGELDMDRADAKLMLSIAAALAGRFFARS
jgi:hypothetical protein